MNPRGSSPHYLIQYHVQVTGCDLYLAMTFIRYLCNLFWTINEIYIIIGENSPLCKESLWLNILVFLGNQ